MKFLYNAEMINIDSKTILKNLSAQLFHTINVYDDDNVIGT